MAPPAGIDHRLRLDRRQHRQPAQRLRQADAQAIQQVQPTVQHPPQRLRRERTRRTAQHQDAVGDPQVQFHHTLREIAHTGQERPLRIVTRRVAQIGLPLGRQRRRCAIGTTLPTHLRNRGIQRRIGIEIEAQRQHTHAIGGDGQHDAGLVRQARDQ
jgi:hypothetical protein